MLGAITWMYRKLIEASELKGVANGYQAARALAMRPEQAELALQSARKIPKARLLQGLQSLQTATNRLKGGADDPHAVMEFLISEGLAAPAAKSARPPKRAGANRLFCFFWGAVTCLFFPHFP